MLGCWIGGRGFPESGLGCIGWVIKFELESNRMIIMDEGRAERQHKHEKVRYQEEGVQPGKQEHEASVPWPVVPGEVVNTRN